MTLHRQIVRSPQRRAQHVTIATADNNKMAAIRCYGNDTTTTRWRLHVTIATLPTTIIWHTGVTEYRERKKAEASAMEPQNIIDRRKRNAEYAKQYRAHKKALITASSTVGSNPDVNG